MPREEWCADEGSIEETQHGLEMMLESFKDMLLRKNMEYGNSSLESVGIFVNPEEHKGIESRIEDKLKRIQKSVRHGEGLRRNDVADLIGYLFLLCYREEWTMFGDLVD